MAHNHNWQRVEPTSEVIEQLRQRVPADSVVIDPDDDYNIGYIVEGLDEDGDPYGPLVQVVEWCSGCGRYRLSQQGGDYSVIIQ